MNKIPDFTKPNDVYAFLQNEFGMCGCFETELVVEALKDFLVWCGSDCINRPRYSELFGANQGVFYLISGICDRADLIEHGIAIRHPWLTENGKLFLSALSNFSIEQLEHTEGEAYDGIWHCLMG